MSNASSVKINASQELTHLVNEEKNEREKKPQTVKFILGNP